MTMHYYYKVFNHRLRLVWAFYYPNTVILLTNDLYYVSDTNDPQINA